MFPAIQKIQIFTKLPYTKPKSRLSKRHYSVHNLTSVVHIVRSKVQKAVAKAQKVADSTYIDVKGPFKRHLERERYSLLRNERVNISSHSLNSHISDN